MIELPSVAEVISIDSPPTLSAVVILASLLSAIAADPLMFALTMFVDAVVITIPFSAGKVIVVSLVKLAK